MKLALAQAHAQFVIGDRSAGATFAGDFAADVRSSKLFIDPLNPRFASSGLMLSIYNYLINSDFTKQ